VFNNFGRQREIVNGDLQLVISDATLPGTVELNNINHASAELAVGGMSPSETEVLTYADALRDSGMFSQVIVSNIEETEDGVIFTLLLITKE